LAETISLGAADGVALLTLRRPEVRNMLSLQMVDEIVAAVAEAEAREDVHAVVVTGEGRGFCSGADLDLLRTGDPATFRRIYDGFLALARCSLPTIAAVNGPAVGAGLNLALACDVRIAARAARFVVRFPEIGLHPGGGHTWLLERCVGPDAAAAMLLFGVQLDGEDAARRGLALRCVEDDAVVAESRALAAGAVRVPRELLLRVKETLRAVPAIGDHATAVEAEFETQSWSIRQPFFQERLAALVQQLDKQKEQKA
jgi:enoyl-CoA hydratase